MIWKISSNDCTQRTDWPWSPIRSVDLGYERTENEVSIPEDGLSETGISEREEVIV